LGIFPASKAGFFIQPLKMDLTEGSETSAKLNQTPVKYPKQNIQVSVRTVSTSLLTVQNRHKLHIAVQVL
jgi:hypothetical protein